LGLTHGDGVVDLEDHDDALDGEAYGFGLGFRV